MVDSLQRKPLTLADIRTKRWTKKGNGRLLPLNSDAWSQAAPLSAGRGATVPNTARQRRRARH